MTEIEFWFELASPYSYLSAMRVDAEAARRSIAVRWRPFLLGPIFAAQGWNTSPFNIYEAKGVHMWRDIERLCEKRGVAFRRPGPDWLAGFPYRTVAAARLAVIGLDGGWGKDFVRAVYRAEFAAHRDIAAEAVLTDCLHEAGADPEAARAAAGAPENKPRLRAATEEAQARGLFGAPSFLAGGELFWGDDRLGDALDWAAASGR